MQLKQDLGRAIIDNKVIDLVVNPVAWNSYFHFRIYDGTIIFDEEKDIARKCSFCSHRIDEGQLPFCVVCCETEAMYFGDLNDPESSVSKIISSGNAKTIVKDTDTGPVVYYCPTRSGKIL